MPGTLPDPRPQIVEGSLVRGMRCVDCAYPTPAPRPRCPVCGGGMQEADFGPHGAVWSSTVVRVAVPERAPPYALAYVDLDDGPRILAHVAGADEPVAIGSRVRVAGRTDAGDPLVQVVG